MVETAGNIGTKHIHKREKKKKKKDLFSSLNDTEGNTLFKNAFDLLNIQRHSNR